MKKLLQKKNIRKSYYIQVDKRTGNKWKNENNAKSKSFEKEENLYYSE